MYAFVWTAADNTRSCSPSPASVMALQNGGGDNGRDIASSLYCKRNWRLRASVYSKSRRSQKTLSIRLLNVSERERAYLGLGLKMHHRFCIVFKSLSFWHPLMSTTDLLTRMFWHVPFSHCRTVLISLVMTSFGKWKLPWNDLLLLTTVL